MPKLARVGDSASGTCSHPSHSSPISVTGTIISGSSDVMVEGKPLARVGDAVQASCGHMATIVSGSSKFFNDGKAAARVGDPVSGDWSGTITGGSSKHSSV